MKALMISAAVLALAGCKQEAVKCSTPELAYKQSQIIVKRQLRDPDSAVFEPFSASGVFIQRPLDCKYIISALYRARNGFGGMNRGHYRMTLITNEAGDSWTLVRSDIQ